MKNEEKKEDDMQSAMDKIMKKIDNQKAQREKERSMIPQKKNNKKTFSKKEVMSHNKPGDAWIIVNKKVYNVSNFAENHPGGVDEIKSCIGTGRDHDADFESADHSKRSKNELKKMYIGDLE